MELTEELFRAFSADDTGDSHDDTMDLDFLVGVHDHLETETAEEAALDDLEQLLAALDKATKDAENSIRSAAYRREAKKPRPNMDELREGLEARPVDLTRAICSICDEGKVKIGGHGEVVLGIGHLASFFCSENCIGTA